MRLLLIFVLSWLAGLAAVSAISYFVYDELSRADFFGFAGFSLVGASLATALLYAPGLFWLRRLLGGCRPAIVFPVASSLFLNGPIFLIVALVAGRKIVSSEAVLFVSGFLATGLLFGIGFIWNYRERVT